MATLVLNVTPVLIREGTTVLVACLPYESREQLRALRQQYGKDVLFARSRDSIDAVHFVRDVRPFDGELHEKPLNNEPRIAARLIERAIVSKLVGLGRTILDVDPIHFLSEKDSDDVVKATGAPLPSWLRVRLAYRIHIRVRHPREQAATPIIVADTHVRHDIELPVSELLRAGIDLRGLYVVQDLSVASEPFRRRPLLGRIEAIEGATLVLGDHRAGGDRVRASEAFLEPRDDATERCAERILGRNAENILKRIDEYALRLQSAESRHGRIQATMNFLAREELALAQGASAQIGDFVSQGTDTFWPTRTASRVTYVFDPRGVKLFDRNAEGLERHGPYSSRTSFKASPRICVVAEASEQGEVERFLYKFFEGIENTIYARGFRGLFAMSPSQPTFFLARDGTASSYRRAVQQAVEATASEGCSPWDLALVQVRESTRF